MKYQFADCVLDDAAFVLERKAQAVNVEPLVFDLLLLLLRNPDVVVTRDQMVEQVWHGRIVSDSAITACIAAARKAVGDDGKQQTIIRTVARRGLQFVAAVELLTPPPVDAVASGGEPAEAPVAAGEVPAPRLRFAKSASGKALAYALSGAGPRVLWIGPVLTTDVEAEWHCPSARRTIDDLGQVCTVLRYDHLGCGRSDRTADGFDFTAMAGDALRVTEAAGWDRFAVYCESGGVHVGLRLAALHPDRVSRLAIIGGYVTGRSLRRQDQAPDAIRGIIDEGWRDDNNSFLTAFLYPYFPEGPMEAVEEHARLMRNAVSHEAILAIRDAINTVSNADLLDKVRCPTLVFHGRRDSVHPVSEAQALTAGIEGAELVILETANHFPLPGNPTYPGFIAALRDFLSQG